MDVSRYAPGELSAKARGSTTNWTMGRSAAADPSPGGCPPTRRRNPHWGIRDQAAREVQRAQAQLAAWPVPQAAKPGTYAGAAARQPGIPAQPRAPPLQPTTDALVRLSPSSTAVWPRRPYKGDAQDLLTPRGVQ